MLKLNIYFFKNVHFANIAFKVSSDMSTTLGRGLVKRRKRSWFVLNNIRFCRLKHSWKLLRSPWKYPLPSPPNMAGNSQHENICFIRHKRGCRMSQMMLKWVSRLVGWLAWWRTAVPSLAAEMTRWHASGWKGQLIYTYTEHTVMWSALKHLWLY